MKQFQTIATGIDVSAAVTQLDGQPELWDLNAGRVRDPASPHRETSDIWVRYRDPKELTDSFSFREPHQSVWYPAWRALPALRSIVFGLAAKVEAVQIGGILITRMPPDSTVYPHDDRGTWHSTFYNAKVWLPLRANDRCFNFCEDDCVVMAPGEGWTFDNLRTHFVRNAGATERLCLICCFRSEP